MISQAKAEHSTIEFEASGASRSVAPREGWLIVILMTIAIGLVGVTVANGRLDDRQTLFVAMAVGGFWLGFVFAKLRLLDLFAHAVTFAIALVVGINAVDGGTAIADLRAGDWELLRDRADHRLEALVSSFRTGSSLPDDVAAFAIGATILLVGYSSAWMLFRRGWYSWSILLPGSIMLFGLALDRDAAVWPAFAFVCIAIALLARHDAIERSRAWQHRGFSNPARYAVRSAVAGVVIGLVALAAGLLTPLTVPDEALTWAAARSEQLQEYLAEQADRFVDPSDAPPGVADYTTFDNAFDIGAGTPQGDVPLVLVQSESRSYLAARKFDTYNGRGWDSTFQEQLADQEKLPNPPLVAFAPNQSMYLEPNIVDSRAMDVGVISLLEPMGGLLLTLETHYEVSVGSTARVGWKYIDQVFVVDEVDLRELPLDLRNFIQMLRGETFTVDASGSPVLDDPGLAQDVRTVQANLFDKYPLDVALDVDDAGRLIVLAEGRVPMYDDIEAVYFAEGRDAAMSYRAIGLKPRRSPDQIAIASADYPTEIVDRYLAVPETVTDRTRELAIQIVRDAGAGDPYSMAMAIQSYLRSSYGYIIDSNLPPDGQDAVDYFLFDRQMGRCDHFASAMAIMLRTLDVPTRIVTGFAPVEFDLAANGYLYRGRDAHSWVEVYFPGQGWVPFEPTPSESPIEDGGDQREAVTELSTPTPQPTLAPEPTLAASPVPESTQVPPGPVTNEPSSGSPQLSGRTLIALAGIASAAGLLLTTFIVWHWRLRGLPPGAAYFMRLSRAARFWGIPADPTRTPAELASMFGRVAPASEQAAQQIAEAYAMERYGDTTRSDRIAMNARRGWAEVRRSLVRWRPWRRGS